MATTGAGDAIAALERMMLRGEVGADAAAEAMGEVYRRAVQRQLTLSSHAPGTPTPSSPGTPPATVSGALAGSVAMEHTGPGSVMVGGTTAYARIQQFGGMSGIGRKTHTPARPYLEPAWEDCADEARTAALEIFTEEIYG